MRSRTSIAMECVPPDRGVDGETSQKIVLIAKIEKFENRTSAAWRT